MPYVLRVAFILKILQRKSSCARFEVLLQWFMFEDHSAPWQNNYLVPPSLKMPSRSNAAYGDACTSVENHMYICGRQVDGTSSIIWRGHDIRVVFCATGCSSSSMDYRALQYERSTAFWNQYSTHRGHMLSAVPEQTYIIKFILYWTQDRFFSLIALIAFL